MKKLFILIPLLASSLISASQSSPRSGSNSPTVRDLSPQGQKYFNDNVFIPVQQNMQSLGQNLANLQAQNEAFKWKRAGTPEKRKYTYNQIKNICQEACQAKFINSEIQTNQIINCCRKIKGAFQIIPNPSSPNPLSQTIQDSLFVIKDNVNLEGVIDQAKKL
jgi:hypothetical protein